VKKFFKDGCIVAPWRHGAMAAMAAMAATAARRVLKSD
jgi:hypothetical protein